MVDASGAPIPHAFLNAYNLATGKVLEKWSDGNGRFAFEAVPPGSYELKVEKPGFVAMMRRFEVTQGSMTTFRFVMKLGPVDGEPSTPLYSTNRFESTEIFFLDQRTGWVLLRDKRKTYLFKTTDGGESWSSNRIPKGIGTVCFVDTRIGWALRGSKSRGRNFSYLLQTSDGGATWKQPMTKPLEANLPHGERVIGMAFGDAQTGWFITSGTGLTGSVLLTQDGGKSVRKVSGIPKDDWDYRDIFVIPSGRVWILGSNDILSTQDSGKTWEQQFNSIQPRPSFWATILDSGWFLPDGHGWIVGQEIHERIILATSDFGRNWQRVFDSPEPPSFDSIYFSDDEHGCAVGSFESLLCTDDGGTTWAERNVLPPPNDTQADFFIKIVMLKSGRGFLLRAGGYLYETVDGGQTWRALDLLPNHPRR